MMRVLDGQVALLRSKISEANVSLEAAVVAMDRAVSDLAPVPLGDKRMTTAAVDRSFCRLKQAQHLLRDLERMLAAVMAGPSA